jgi:methyl-accepting chemotaxis protein WspA
LIGEVQHSTGHLAQTVVQLSEMSRNQGEGATRLSLATNEIAAATQQISATSDELLNTMTSVTHVTNETSQLANEGQESLGRMEVVMRDLVDASSSVSRRLGMIAERTEIIASVTTTITKIADQTNLLSLNASMEADKAGEYGVGFAVLAREIRRLADQTALATLDIEQMVQEMKDAVSGGVSEMRRFAEKVDRSVKDTQESNGRFSEILDRVRFMLPRFAEVHESMRSQSSGARQIRDAMEGLKDTAQSTQASVRAMSDATQQLEGAIESLKKEVSIFRVQ